MLLKKDIGNTQECLEDSGMCPVMHARKCSCPEYVTVYKMPGDGGRGGGGSH